MHQLTKHGCVWVFGVRESYCILTSSLFTRLGPLCLFPVSRIQISPLFHKATHLLSKFSIFQSVLNSSSLSNWLAMPINRSICGLRLITELQIQRLKVQILSEASFYHDFDIHFQALLMVRECRKHSLSILYLSWRKKDSTFQYWQH